jgi:iron uptake system component EfeO
MHWEAIEPVAETFGDLDPRTDAREADLAEGDEWAGWHLIEKDLWPAGAEAGYQPLSDADRTEYADRLLTDLSTLKGEVADADYTGEQIANGAKELLDEVANGKVTGEEEFWSHTDLYDFQANVDGARVGFEGLKPLLEVKDPELAKQIEAAFDSLQALLDKYKVGEDDFVSYDKVTEAQRKELSDAVNTLAEPLSKMTGAITL